ncbi:ABC transporter permease [Aliiruegeria lutimaris]|uniref:Putative ABC transport system permease protein n=1 Tax=Aliiruegeria lutimaris TaxID=571298 RepID=A0A1G9J7H6_9RHOB|nr:ABC transporter permease [Aliiruegeria lutimaris]SDL33480.1 putative ABC transport system permease protein [Aliiruegeria lutimaris]
MMTSLSLAVGSLWNRRFVAALTVLAIALSVFLVIGVERLRVSAKESFANSASGIDLIVASRGNPVQVLMATVFGVGSTGPGIDWDSYEMVEALPQVAWAVPIAMGDNHRGYPVVGTTPEYFEHFRHSSGRPLAFTSGHSFSEEDGAVIGAEIATRFGYEIGTTVVNAHGAGEVAFDLHDEAPFVVTGILMPTGTAVDRMVFVSLEGFDRLHAEKTTSVDPFAQETRANSDPVEDATDGVEADHHDHAHEPDKINAIYVGLADRGAVLSIQRAISEYPAEPLSAVLPAMALIELWSITGAAEQAIVLMASAVALAGIVAMVVMLSASLEVRRREFAILRSVGATPLRIFSLIVLEAGLVTVAGLLLGLVLLGALTAILEPVLLSRFGLQVDASASLLRESWLLLAILMAGLAASFVPAIRVYRMTLADGLSFRL